MTNSFLKRNYAFSYRMSAGWRNLSTNNESAFCGKLQVGLGLALVYKPALLAKTFGLYVSMELFGLLLWERDVCPFVWCG